MGSRFDPEIYAPSREDLLAAMGGWPAAEWNHVVSLYDGEIAYTDRAVGALLDGLEERGLSENTLLVFLSDHGQEFFEHGAYGHGHSLYGEVLRVPLVFSFPARIPEGRRVREQVRLIDVMPTILDILGVAAVSRVRGCEPAAADDGHGWREARPSRGPARGNGVLRRGETWRGKEVADNGRGQGDPRRGLRRDPGVRSRSRPRRGQRPVGCKPSGSRSLPWRLCSKRSSK